MNSYKFKSYKEAVEYSINLSKKFKNKNEYYTSNEYKNLYPILINLFNIEKDNQLHELQLLSKKSLEDSNQKVGDIVIYSQINTFMNIETIIGKIFLKNGIPYVKDFKTNTLYRWNKGFKIYNRKLKNE